MAEAMNNENGSGGWSLPGSTNYLYAPVTIKGFCMLPIKHHLVIHYWRGVGTYYEKEWFKDSRAEKYRHDFEYIDSNLRLGPTHVTGTHMSGGSNESSLPLLDIYLLTPAE